MNFKVHAVSSDGYLSNLVLLLIFLATKMADGKF